MDNRRESSYDRRHTFDKLRHFFNSVTAEGLLRLHFIWGTLVKNVGGDRAEMDRRQRA
ncbi:MAG: hypothetical protein ACE5D4_03915 [Thermodesulfobacteriota bacterium]